MGHVARSEHPALLGDAEWRRLLAVVDELAGEGLDELRERMVAEIETLKVGVSTDDAAQYGPVVTAAHRQRIADYIQLGVDERFRNFDAVGAYAAGFLLALLSLLILAAMTVLSRRKEHAR